MKNSWPGVRETWASDLTGAGVTATLVAYGQGEKFSGYPATVVKLRTSSWHGHTNGDTSSCPGPYPTVACPEFQVGCRLCQELFILPMYV